MKRIVPALMVLHILLLALAATNFTLVTVLWRPHAWTVNYYAWAFCSGFGFRYVSDYSLPQALAYLAGYALGLPLFAIALGRRWEGLGWCGLILCLLGAISFTIESSHWITDHNNSWIISCPGGMLVLWIVWGIRAWQGTRELRRSGATPPAA